MSKLTVYSHYTDKETLFFAAIRASCAEQMPSMLFSVDATAPVRQQLEAIARAFFGLGTAGESFALHRLLISGGDMPEKLVQMYWEAGPQRVQSGFQEFLRQEVAGGQLVISDIPRASSQFFALLKGELHARMLCGCSQPFSERDIDMHIRATVEFFLRAYAVSPDRLVAL